MCPARAATIVASCLLAVCRSHAQQPKGAAPPAAPAAATAPAPFKWHTDFENARQVAIKPKLDLLLAFTSAASPASAELCGKLETEVFATPEFQTEAPKAFLLVRVDQPADESAVPAPLRLQNAQLRKRFPSDRLPAVWLCDSYGRAYAVTGYVPGGAKPFLAWMKDRGDAGRAARDALLRAGPLRGVERAKTLAEGLLGLDDAIVAANHNKELLEMIQLDADGSAGIKARCDAILRDAAAWPLVVRMQAELQALREQGQWSDLAAQVEHQRGRHKGERGAEQCLLFMEGIGQLEGRKDAAGALTLLDAALALAPRSELAPEIARSRQDAEAAVAAQQAREEAERKAEEARKKAQDKKKK
jgi:protein disulfide-isomerase